MVPEGFQFPVLVPECQVEKSLAEPDILQAVLPPSVVFTLVVLYCLITAAEDEAPASKWINWVLLNSTVLPSS